MSSEASKPVPKKPAVSAKNAAVLIIDDSGLSRIALAHYVKRHGYRAEVAEGGRQGLEMLRADNFELLFLDLFMPDLDGYAVLELLRADPNLRSVPVIMITGENELDCMTRCFELGAKGYLLKPVDPVQIKEKLTTFLEKPA